MDVLNRLSGLHRNRGAQGRMAIHQRLKRAPGRRDVHIGANASGKTDIVNRTLRCQLAQEPESPADYPRAGGSAGSRSPSSAGVGEGAHVCRSVKARRSAATTPMSGLAPGRRFRCPPLVVSVPMGSRSPVKGVSIPRGSQRLPANNGRWALPIALPFQAGAARSTALSPPKANEFDIATLIIACRATFGTTSRSQSGSISSKLAVGGIVW